MFNDSDLSRISVTQTQAAADSEIELEGRPTLGPQAERPHTLGGQAKTNR
jgi:hypothetical protein